MPTARQGIGRVFFADFFHLPYDSRRTGEYSEQQCTGGKVMQSSQKKQLLCLRTGDDRKSHFEYACFILKDSRAPDGTEDDIVREAERIIEQAERLLPAAGKKARKPRRPHRRSFWSGLLTGFGICAAIFSAAAYFYLFLP